MGEEITANNHEARRRCFATPGSSIGAYPFSRRNPFSGKGEGSHIKINAGQLSLVRAKRRQDSASPTADLQDRARRFRRHSPPIREVAVSGGG